MNRNAVIYVDQEINPAGKVIVDPELLWPAARPEPEPLVSAHWLFSIGGGSRFDLYTGQVASKQGSGSHPWTGYSVKTGGLGQALMTPIDDANEQTFCCVVKRPPANAILMGTLTTVVADGGGALVNAAASTHVSFNMRRTGGTSTLSGSSGSTRGAAWGVSVGEWAFLAGVHRGTGTRLIRVFVGSPGGIDHNEAPPGNDKILSANKIAIGPSHYTSGDFANTPVEVAEAMWVGAVRSVDQLTAIYNRSKERMAAMGITI